VWIGQGHALGTLRIFLINRVDEIESYTLVFWNPSSAIYAVIPGGPSMDKTRRPFRLKQVLRKFWRSHVADECPDERERIRRERINNIMQNVVLLEAMRRWEVETRGR
jgi:hypothetical protein